jgi:hypothetical protein
MCISYIYSGTSSKTEITAKSSSTSISNLPIIVKNVIDLTLNDQTATVVFDEFRTGNICMYIYVYIYMYINFFFSQNFLQIIIEDFITNYLFQNY